MFSHIEVREYNITLGNRLIKRDLGPALTLNWTHSESKIIPINTYESQRHGKRRKNEESLRLNRSERISYLKDRSDIPCKTLELAMKSGMRNCFSSGNLASLGMNMSVIEKSPVRQGHPKNIKNIETGRVYANDTPSITSKNNSVSMTEIAKLLKTSVPTKKRQFSPSQLMKQKTQPSLKENRKKKPSKRMKKQDEVNTRTSAATASVNSQTTDSTSSYKTVKHGLKRVESLKHLWESLQTHRLVSSA